MIVMVICNASTYLSSILITTLCFPNNSLASRVAMQKATKQPASTNAKYAEQFAYQKSCILFSLMTIIAVKKH